MIFSDLEFSKKLERTEARVNADFVETRVRVDASSDSAWIEVGGAYAMFDGSDSPLTQTFGLGLFEDATAEHLDEIETFYAKHDAPVFHEVSPMTDPSLMSLLASRGYQPMELTSVMYRELADDIVKREHDPDLATRVITPDEVELWAQTSADGWRAEYEDLGDFMFNFASVSAQCRGAFPFLAELKGLAVSTGMLFIYDEICVLAGASTIPAGRNKGAQTALLEDRLTFAAQKGCKLAIIGATPGSQSQKNAQKNGFDLAYTRTKWSLVTTR